MEITLEITGYCPNYCDYCSTNAGPKNTDRLSVEEVIEFLDQFDDKDIDRINISGGEPLSHSNFYYILKICKRRTDNVWVYTNALDKIMYNTDIVKEIEVDANVCLAPGKESYIPRKANKVHLLQLVKQGRAKDLEPANLQASGNIPKGVCDCSECDHVLLQANKKVVKAPCQKEY